MMKVKVRADMDLYVLIINGHPSALQLLQLIIAVACVARVRPVHPVQGTNVFSGCVGLIAIYCMRYVNGCLTILRKVSSLISL